jgi:hypothetical protein
LRHAVELADWVGAGCAVTAKRVLRRADVPLVGRALGIEVPHRLRSAADAPALHHPWTSALAVGLLSISGGRAVPGPALSGWRTADADETLDGWSRAVAAALVDTFEDDGDGSEALEIGRLVLTVLAADPAPAGTSQLTTIDQAVIESGGAALYRTFDRGVGHRDPAEVAVRLLAAFDAVAEVEDEWRITPLGRWARSVLGARGTSLLGSADAETETEGICQLKITLRHVRPGCWRRVLVPATATLGDLHDIIRITFAWDDDHLHAFTVGRRRYGDPDFDFEDDENKFTLADVVSRGRKSMSYVYDFGDNWLHDIDVEKVVEPDAATAYPVCVAGRGDAPVEDVGEDEDAWIPFDQVGINAQLAHLGSVAREVETQLWDDVEVVLTDIHGEAEEMTAFQTVLDAEIDFPVPAVLLGEPVVVTGLTEGDATHELRARCRGKSVKGLVAFADLEFRPGTVEAWLHAAYLRYLGRSSQPVPLRPPGWGGLAHWRS